MRLIILAVLGTLLSGCTMKFTKSGAGDREMRHDWTGCQAKAGQSFGPGTQGSLPWRSFMKDCMVGEGWDEAD